MNKISDTSEIIFHTDGFIWAMGRNGENVEQITYENLRPWEHVAVSHDRRLVAANYYADEGQSQLWLFDLEAQTEVRLMPDFYSAGGGGVSWDPSGYVYFAAREGEGLQEIFKIKYDSTDLSNLTNTPDKWEGDVGVSEDGKLITYNKIIPEERTCGIWVARPDGSNPRQVFRGGEPGVESAHDSEISPDNKKVVFSVVNPEFKNWPEIPMFNTAHDLWIVNIDGTDPRRLTKPGPISIIPNWKGDWIAYCELSEKDDFKGMSLVKFDGTGKRRIREEFGMPKWIPGPVDRHRENVGPH